MWLLCDCYVIVLYSDSISMRRNSTFALHGVQGICTAQIIYRNRVNENVAGAGVTFLDLKQDSANHRLENAASASSHYFRVKENAKTHSGQGFSKSFLRLSEKCFRRLELLDWHLRKTLYNAYFRYEIFRRHLSYLLKHFRYIRKYF